MKALTLTQPWATLVAMGTKRIETRSWATSYRGPLAIHAGAGLGPVGGKTGLRRLCRDNERFYRVLRDHITSIHGEPLEPAEHLPRGAIVVVVRLVSIHRITESGVEGFNPQPPASEIAYGDYTPGRYAWLLADVWPLAEPVPCRGALGLWNPPAEVLERVRAQL